MAAFAAIADEDKRPESTHQALWIAAVTLYGRAFSNGMRHVVRPTTDGYSPEQLAAHNYVLAIRNKFVAHSVNGFEQANVFAIVSGDTAETLTISGVGSQHTSLASLRRDRTELLASLCTVQKSSLSARRRQVENAIKEELFAAGPDFVLGLAELGMPDVDDSAVDRGRQPSWG